ncbi:MAG: ABC transporter permease [Pseudomonadales bacterium]|nr:ABC transporter permease [Pseudomonadales bacterium]
MMTYYLQNALRGIKRSPGLSLLVVAAIAIGIGVSITMLTVYHLMSSNPVPEKSEQLFRVQVDSWDPLRPFDDDRPERAPHQMTWRDAMAILEQAPAPRQVAMFEALVIIQPPDAQQLPFEATTRMANGDFFPMFNVPFLYGGGWSRHEDEAATQVAVLSRTLNDKLYGGDNSVGKKLVINDRVFTITGVMNSWSPVPRFYDVINSPFQEVSEIFLPVALTPGMEMRSAGSDWGWKAERINTFEDWLASESAWLQFWAELPTSADQRTYLSFLDAYANEQKLLGRFQRPINNHIHDVMAWMAYMEVVEEDVAVLVGLGFLFLLVCLLSSVALLLTKFNGMSAEMSLRRALGATRMQIVGQNLTEVSIIGLTGGVFGLLFTMLSLYGIKSMISRVPDALFRLDGTMIAAAIGLSVLAAVLAGLYPAIRACTLTPAQQLKTQ